MTDPMSDLPLKTRLRNGLRRSLGPALVHALYAGLRATWLLRFDECASFREALATRRPVIIAHWHGDELALIHLATRYRIATLTSNSRDGELMDGVLHRLGAATARGSSSKGGAAGLRALVQLCRRDGHNVSFAVDGPKGPLYQVKPGVFEFSRLLDAPVYAISVGVGSPWVMRRSWNRAVLPKPFSLVHVRVAECLPPVTREQDPRDPALAQTLAAALHEGKRIACDVVGVQRS